MDGFAAIFPGDLELLDLGPEPDLLVEEYFEFDFLNEMNGSDGYFDGHVMDNLLDSFVVACSFLPFEFAVVVELDLLPVLLTLGVL